LKSVALGLDTTKFERENVPYELLWLTVLEVLRRK